MKMTNRFLSLSLTCIVLFIVSACAPLEVTQTSTVVDDRPILMFNFEQRIPQEPVAIFIDGLHMGNAVDFRSEKKGLKIIPGSHIVKLEYLNNIILDKKMYIGNGITKIINVNIQ